MQLSVKVLGLISSVRVEGDPPADLSTFQVHITVKYSRHTTR